MEVIEQQKVLFDTLLNQNIISLSRVVVATQGDNLEDREILENTLIFALENGQNIELLTTQSETIQKNIGHNNELNCFADYELEDDEFLSIQSVRSPDINLPLTIAKITEVWVGLEKEEFLVAIALWNLEQEPVLWLCTETDEIELMTLEGLQQRLLDLAITYQSLSFINSDGERFRVTLKDDSDNYNVHSTSTIMKLTHFFNSRGFCIKRF